MYVLDHLPTATYYLLTVAVPKLP